VSLPDETQGPSGPSGAAFERKQEVAAPFQRFRKCLQEDIRPTMPDHIVNFVRFLDTGTTNRIEQGGLLTKVDDGVVIEEMERGADQGVLEMLAAVARGEDYNHRRGDRGILKLTPVATGEKDRNHLGKDQDDLELMARVTKGEEQSRRCPKDDQASVGSGSTMDLNTMYKTKERKVQPIHDSTVVPHKVEGREDWRERAGVRYQPNKDQTWRQFGSLIKDRTAPFPKGLRVTEERFKEMKIAEWLWPREVEML
jgi:hypothetical protein